MGGRQLPPGWNTCTPVPNNIPARRLSRHRVRDLLLRVVAVAGQLVISRRSTRARAIERVLFLRPDHLGDYLFATPALQRWIDSLSCTSMSRIHTTLYVGPWCEDLARHGPSIDRLMVFPFPGFTRARRGSWLTPYRALVQMAREIRLHRYDMCVVLRPDHWWGGLMASMAGIPVRVGYATEPLRWFLTDALPYEKRVHEVERNLSLVDAALGLVSSAALRAQVGGFPRLVYHVREEERTAVLTILHGRGILAGDKQLIVIHVGAGALVKRWPPEYFAALADRLIETAGVQVVLTGAWEELGDAWRVVAYMTHHAHVLAGQMSLGELAALLERASLVIGSDSGPLHLAVAVGVPSLHLFGPADAKQFGPWSDEPTHHKVIVAQCECVPCGRLDYSAEELIAHRCMESISVDEVFEQAMSLLNL